MLTSKNGYRISVFNYINMPEYITSGSSIFIIESRMCDADIEAVKNLKPLINRILVCSKWPVNRLSN
jgi:hypothetical protein